MLTILWFSMLHKSLRRACYNNYMLLLARYILISRNDPNELNHTPVCRVFVMTM